MSANTALITDAAKLATRQTLSDYSAGVFAHTTGDWTKHNVVRIHEVAYSDSAGHTDTLHTLRLVATQFASGVETELVLAVPVNATGESVQVTSGPLITVQPVSQSVVTGTTVRFVVGAISDTTMSFQWYKDGTALTGQTASQLVLPKVTSANAGSYYVTVSNVNGSATSATATLAVAAGTISFDEGGSGFDILGAATFPFSAFF